MNKTLYTLISRRSYCMGGQRQQARGVDDEGNVGNFVETEQILQVNGQLFSYTSIRGSAPVFWTQGGSSNSFKITRSLELTINAFNLHFTHLVDLYGKVFCLNLLSQSRQNEQQLTELYEILIDTFNSNKIKYQYFDYSAVCGRGSYHQMNPFIIKLESIIDNLSYYHYNLNDKKCIAQQNGVFRVNCLDCLDRTNAFITKLYFFVIYKQLLTVSLNIEKIGIFNEHILDFLDESNKKAQHDFVLKYKHTLADNANCLSLIYAGTESTTSEMTRSGKKGILGFIGDGITQLNRMVLSSFDVQQKQVVMESLINAQHQSDLDKKLKEQESQYSQSGSVKILVITWNVNGALPQFGGTLKDTIFDIEQEGSPDIIVVGLQEMVHLNPQNVMIMSNETQSINWDLLLKQNTKHLGNYAEVAKANLVGIYTTILVKREEAKRISQIETEIIKTGLGGTLGNKGATALRFNINQTKFTFINCHLAAGHKNLDDRLQDIVDIHEKLFSKKGFQDSDYIFFMGDMNFRVESTYSYMTQQIQLYGEQFNIDRNMAIKTLNQLLLIDQLIRSRRGHPLLKKYQEGQILFPPTYKFNPGTDIYDTSKKQRVPSWCDRILYRANGEFGQIEQQFYKMRQSLDSDHKPVVAYFTAKVKMINFSMRESIKNQMKSEQKQQNESANFELKDVQNENQFTNQPHSLQFQLNEDGQLQDDILLFE